MGNIIPATSQLDADTLATEYADNALTDVAVLIESTDNMRHEALIVDITSAQWDEIFAAADVARLLVSILGDLTGTPWLGREVPTDDALLSNDRRVIDLRDLLEEIRDEFLKESREENRVFVAEESWADYIEEEYRSTCPVSFRESDWTPFEYIDWERLAENEAYSTITIDGNDYRYRTN